MGTAGLRTILICISYCLLQSLAVQLGSTESLGIIFPEKLCELEAKEILVTNDTVDIYQLHVTSVVRNRFSHTTVTSKVRNCGSSAKEAIFSVLLPEFAFVSGFVMEVGGVNYTAYVKEKDEAKRQYDEARAKGLGAAYVAASARDSNQITITVNVEPQTKAAFYLTYEELLQRRNHHYEMIINLHPGQLVKDLSVEIEILESRRIVDLKALPLRSGSENDISIVGLEPVPFIQTIDDSTAKVALSPSLERQMELAKLLDSAGEGLSCQFVVQYDVERDPSGGEVLIEDGYFVHFFAPSKLPRLPKHVVFLLDASTSMLGKKLKQLKDAMNKILDDLSSDDIFHIVSFDDNANVWLLKKSPHSVSYATDDMQKLTKDSKMLQANTANLQNIGRAKLAVSFMAAQGNTNIYMPLRVAIRLVQLTKLSNANAIYHQPMIVFLTDGAPTVMETSTEKIVKEVTKLNNGLGKTPIFGLSLGPEADRAFVQKLSLSNSGFPKHIYEAIDTPLQLHGFYQQISSPELSDVFFKYESAVKNITQLKFPLHFDGAELVAAGRYDTRTKDNLTTPTVKAWNGEEEVSYQPTVQRSVSNIERVWAYLTVKQLLEKSKNVNVQEQEELKRQAVDLSLKYSFVTSVTSMVVVKPTTSNDVDLVAIAVKHPSTTSLPVFKFDPRIGDDYNLSEPLQLKHHDGVVNLPEGQFKLGLNESIADLVKCSNSILNSEGHCRLLHLCLSDSLSILAGDYVGHFCQLGDGFAGICCPDHWYKGH